jgi:L-threonylcarbamoyladenylate synthase
VGIRIIDNPFVGELLSVTGEPIITTSANVSGEKAPASVDGINKSVLVGADLVIDGGPCRLGVPSRVVDAATGVVIRSA